MHIFNYIQFTSEFLTRFCPTLADNYGLILGTNSPESETSVLTLTSFCFPLLG